MQLDSNIAGLIVKDRQTVTSSGESVKKRIEGLHIMERPSNEDHRGELIEVFNPAWNFHPDPLVYVYSVVVRPQSVRGWVVHLEQEDRIFILSGTLRWAFYDAREGSPTQGMLNEFTFSAHHRVLFVIPSGVLHAVKNIGEGEATFINMPNKPYNHQDPDKYRLPMPNDLISFTF
ncbi:dTDP-4-dehydrorhamnose 3,5-epimerase family protein [Deinococcus roseus]|uniref:dTDP-4-dehydrorhamnose 3,5-epimerase n=1 Tax=Deinococcus roseus TaxID=392414 RepID=A0ABQ2CWC5_9DEIO|nr:dTDP-4-dehydrorhamnose 3,5-epimerase family protein [Deinococcus roseus]GGJ20378.1 hypothetical protein GCM10008938_03250 [Deinococcus roseus]